MNPMVTTGELEQAFCVALLETEVEETNVDGPLCPDELIEESLPPDTVLVEEAVHSYKRHVLLASCAGAGLVLGVFTALLL